MLDNLKAVPSSISRVKHLDKHLQAVQFTFALFLVYCWFTLLKLFFFLLFFTAAGCSFFFFTKMILINSLYTAALHTALLQNK